MRATTGAEMVLPEPPLCAPYLHRTAAHGGGSLGATDPAARLTPGRPWYGSREQGRRASQPRGGPRREPQHPLAPAAPAASACLAAGSDGDATLHPTVPRMAIR